MKTYKILIKYQGKNLDAIEVEADNWEEAQDYVLGNLELIDLDEYPYGNSIEHYDIEREKEL